MLCKRIIPCLDVKGGRVAKGVQFTGLRDVGDPVELARLYQDQGADELVFLDISASHEGRETMIRVVELVAAELMIPLTVGGGVSTLEHVKRLLACGADKVAVNTAAVMRPRLIDEIAADCGAQCCVLAVDARRRTGGDGWEVLTHGGRRVALPDALQWCRQATARGAGEILLTSWDRDGTLSGFDIALTAAVSDAVTVPVIASGGAGGPADFVEAFTAGRADAALAAGIFHDNTWTIRELKTELQAQNIPVRL